MNEFMFVSERAESKLWGVRVLKRGVVLANGFAESCPDT